MEPDMTLNELDNLAANLFETYNIALGDNLPSFFSLSRKEIDAWRNVASEATILECEECQDKDNTIEELTSERRKLEMNLDDYADEIHELHAKVNSLEQTIYDLREDSI